MSRAISHTDFNFPEQQSVYHGKVRDVYIVGEHLVSIATDRISAFDHILPRAIPYKGQVLNQTAAYFLHATRDICPNWLVATPDPNVSIGISCEPIRIEMVIRGYLAGHAARGYRAGRQMLCGVILPDGLKENDKLPTPIITPAAKNLFGHDEDISREDIISQQLVPEAIYRQMEDYTYALFARGTQMAAAQGLILVDTKYEFGLHVGQVYLIDEIHTPDSSRYFYAEGYDARQAAGTAQRQLSKEFVREWLIAGGFEGKEGQVVPTMDDALVQSITDRYIELYERVTGMSFERGDTRIDPLARIDRHVRDWIGEDAF
jgi:phosphoribosylaminoimidazole-succinocarboxamide synthase